MMANCTAASTHELHRTASYHIDTLVSDRTGRFTIIRISSHALDPRSSWAIRICTSCGTTAVRWISIWLHRRWYTSSSTRSMCMANRSRERLSEKSISALRPWSCCCTCRYSSYSTPNTSAVIHPLYISNDLSAFCTLHLLLHSFTIGNLSSFPAPRSFSSFRKNTAVCSAMQIQRTKYKEQPRRNAKRTPPQATRARRRSTLQQHKCKSNKHVTKMQSTV